MAVRWFVNCSRWSPTNQEWIKCMACIQEEETERINQFVFKEDAKRSLVGRLLARRYLCDLTNTRNSNLKLVRTPLGKPHLADPVLTSDCGGIDFSISHHGAYAIIAGQQNCIIGADIMDTTQKGNQGTPSFFHTMRRQFTSEEWGYIKAEQSEPVQLARFYRLWCLKESYVKALGRGIGFGVQRINCQPCLQWSPLATVAMNTEVSIDGKPLKDWKFEEQFIDHQHCIAVAVNPAPLPRPLMFSERTVAELLSPMDCVRPPDLLNWTLFSDKQSRPDQERLRPCR